jgi:membrane-associated protease RseP (regulator of RpoE activity)
MRAADLGLWLTYPPGTTGLTVSDVADSSVFAQAGLLEGDRIVLVNGDPVTTEAQFVEVLSSPSLANQSVSITVARGSQRLKLLVPVSQLMQGIATRDPLYDAGLLIDDRDPNRLVVLRVFPRTPAYYAGLRTGDVLMTVSGRPIVSLNGFVQALDGGNVALEVARSGQPRQLTIDIADLPVRTALRPVLRRDPPPGPVIQGVETVDPTRPVLVVPQAVAPVVVPARPPLGFPPGSQGTIRPGIRGGLNPPARPKTYGGTGTSAGGAGAAGGTGVIEGGTGSTAGGAGAVGGTGAGLRRGN